MIIHDYRRIVVRNNKRIPPEWREVDFIPVFTDSPDNFDEEEIFKQLVEEYSRYLVMDFRPVNEDDRKKYRGVPVGTFRTKDIKKYLKYKEKQIHLAVGDYVRIYRVDLCCKNWDGIERFILENKEVFTEEEFQKLWEYFKLDEEWDFPERKWDTDYLIGSRLPTFIIVKTYHRPASFIGQDSEEHVIYENNEQYFKYYVRRGKSATEIDIAYANGYDFPVEVTGVIYTWPEQEPLPEELEEQFAEWILANAPGEAVTSWLLHVSESGRITKIAKIDERFMMFYLDRVDPMTTLDELIDKLEEIIFGFWDDRVEINLIKYQWLKKSGKWKHIAEKYKFIEKYIELLGDDVVTRALEKLEPKSTPDYWETDEYVENWLSVLWV